MTTTPHAVNSLKEQHGKTNKISPEAVAQEIESVLNRPISSDVGLFEVMTAAGAITKALTMPDPVYLYYNLIQEKELIILFADAGIGKTIFSMQAAIAIAEKGHIVLYFDLELSLKQFQKRYTGEDGSVYKMPGSLYRVGYARLTKTPDGLSYSDFFFQSLEQAIEQTGAKVVFVDNLTKLSAGDTDSAKLAIPILEGLNRIKQKYDITIIVLEHNKKTDPTRPIYLNDLQGSKMKANLVDTVFTIGRSSRDKDTRYIKQLKVRDGELRYDSDNVLVCQIHKDHNFLGFEFLDHGKEADHLKPMSESDEQQLIADVLDMNRAGYTLRQIGERLGISHMKVSRILKNS